MNLRHLVLAAVPLALAACGGAPTLEIQQAAAKTAVAPPSPAAGRCDATPWTGAISPEGRPDGLDAGDALADVAAAGWIASVGLPPQATSAAEPRAAAAKTRWRRFIVVGASLE